MVVAVVVEMVSTAYYTMFPECKEAHTQLAERVNEYENEFTGLKLAHQYTHT